MTEKTEPSDRPAVLFDIDGTLVDSNYLHVQAWSQAFDEIGHPIDDARIHRAIALDSARMLSTLLGAEDADRLGGEAKEQHATFYAELSQRLRPFASARALIQTLAERGAAVVLATSAPESELKLLRAALDVERWLTAVTSGQDVETAKPAPDMVAIAVQRAGARPERSVLIGDTVWDGSSAAKADIMFIAMRSGGIGAAELTAAGARAVYDDPADLLAHLDDSPLAALLA